MKKIILSVVIVLLGLTTGCRLGCAPYDCCGPVYCNPHNCDPNYRSGSAFNAESQAPATTEGVFPEATTDASVITDPASSSIPVETTAPTEVPSQLPSVVSATPVAPAPTASPAPLPSGEIPVNTQIVPQ